MSRDSIKTTMTASWFCSADLLLCSPTISEHAYASCPQVLMPTLNKACSRAESRVEALTRTGISSIQATTDASMLSASVLLPSRHEAVSTK